MNRKRGEPMSRIKDPLTGEVRNKEVTSFSPPAEEVSTPLMSAASYSKRVEERRQIMADAKSHRTPLGHAPPIPPGKLAPLANAARAVQMPSPDFGLPKVQEPTSEQLQEWASPKEPEKPVIPGIGSGFEVNQAIARGEVDRPVNMRQAKEMARAEAARRSEAKNMSAETQQLLQAQHAANSGEASEFEVSKLPANKKALDEAEQVLTERKWDDQIGFDFEALRRASIPLLSAERKKLIESNLAPLDFEDLITKREIVQEVHIIPGKFSVGYRTVREREHVWVLQYIYEVTGVSSASYIEELGNVCRLVCSIRSINGKLLPDHRNNIGQINEEVDKEKFRKKLDIIMGFPTHVVADLGINFNWFSERVTKLFSVENLKNG
jgi:hypothetical protein